MRFLYLLLLSTTTLAQNTDTLYLHTAPKPDMVFVKGGSFEMGAEDYKKNSDLSNATPHRVELSDFYIGRYEVTFAEYDLFCEATGREKPEDQGWGRGKRPVINVHWYDAVAYCNWLSSEHGLTKAYKIDKINKDPNNQNNYDKIRWTVTWDTTATGYRLPTEAEWEYVARDGGKAIKYPWGNEEEPAEKVANTGAGFSSNYNDGYEYTSPAGAMKPSGTLGVCDISGNVWEWCWDWYDENYYKNSPKKNPRGADAGAIRMLRGGSWYNSLAYYFRSAYRFYNLPYDENSCIGFRLAVRPSVHR